MANQARFIIRLPIFFTKHPKIQIRALIKRMADKVVCIDVVATYGLTSLTSLLPCHLVLILHQCHCNLMLTSWNWNFHHHWKSSRTQMTLILHTYQGIVAQDYFKQSADTIKTAC